MKIKFKKIDIENFLSIGHIELDLNDKGYTLINGINNDPNDNASSNGSGKSSIGEAICWVLTNKTIRGIDKGISNLRTEGGAKVELDFEVDGVPYKIIRYRDHKKLGNGLQLFVNGEEKSGKGVRDSNKILSEYLPELTHSLIGSVIILGQGLPQKFTNNAPSGRKEVLEKLSKSDFMIEDIKNRLTNRKINLSQDLRKVEDKLLSITSQTATYKKQLESFKTQFSNLEDSSSLLSLISQLEDKCVKLRENISKLNSEISNKRNEIESYKLRQSNLNNELTNETQAVKNNYLNSKQEIQKQLFQFQSEAKALNNEIVKLESVKDICPTCGQKLPDVHKVDTTDKRREWDSLKLRCDELQAQIKDLDKKEFNEVEEVKLKYKEEQLNLINSLNKLNLELSSLNQEYNSNNNELRAQENVLLNTKARYNGFTQQKQSLEDNIKSIEEELIKLSNEELYNTSDRDDVKSRLDVVSKMLTIATRDFRGFLLKNVIEYINKRAKLYSQDIFDIDKIEFILNGNNIDIYYNSKPYECLSGGEARKIDIIVNFSLRDMLCQFSNFRSNLLILDEIFDNTDVDGCNAIINTITKRLTDIESIFVVTHRANLMIPADSTITIIKDENGISRIQ